MVLFHEESEDTTMIGLESWDGLYEVEMKDCTQSANIATHRSYKP